MLGDLCVHRALLGVSSLGPRWTGAAALGLHLLSRGGEPELFSYHVGEDVEGSDVGALAPADTDLRLGAPSSGCGGLCVRLAEAPELGTPSCSHQQSLAP